MNRCWHIMLCGFLILGCHGQKPKVSIEKKQDTNDSVVALVERATIAEKIYKKVDSIARLEERDTAAVKKQLKKSTVINKRKQERLQTVSATIWSDEQIDFLNQVEKILLFSVRITDIGSRKLELDSQLNPSDQEVFIQVLLHPESYPDTSLVESSNGKKFEPDYQMLLEAG